MQRNTLNAFDIIEEFPEPGRKPIEYSPLPI